MSGFLFGADGMKRKQGVLYFIACHKDNAIKVGFTRNVQRRLVELQNGCPLKLSIVGTLDSFQSFETVMKWMLHSERIRGEWFRMTENVKFTIRDFLTLEGAKVYERI